MKTKWTTEEDKLLLKLVNNKVPYKNIIDYFDNRTQDSIRNRVWILNEQKRNEWLDGEVIAAFDIETSDLKADVGFVISWVIITNTGTMYSSKIKRSEILNGRLDKRVLQEFVDTLPNIDVLVGYYSTKFDVPYMRTRCEIQGIDFPSYGAVKHLDLYYLVKSKFKLRNNRLDTILHALGLPGKTHVDLDDWNKARIGNSDSIEKIYQYNIKDVEKTQQVFDRISKYRKWTRRSI